MNHITYTHIGKRDENQDLIHIENIGLNTQLYLVVDGMGGYENGALAAKIVAENLSTFLATIKKVTKADLQKGVNKANLALKKQKASSQTKMGATIGGVIIEENNAICFWVGDVKIFHFKNNKLFYESTEHTLVKELATNKAISNPKQLSKYQHIVTRSVQGEIDKSQISSIELTDISNNDLIFVCSDGVHNIMDGHSLGYILRNSINLDTAIETITNRLKLESIDNASLILIKK